jgi:cation diffusion facilitator CzcD-associated flavoprotein CzcO
MHSTAQKTNTVMVIGAGASGLAVAYALRELGISVRIVESATRRSVVVEG